MKYFCGCFLVVAVLLFTAPPRNRPEQWSKQLVIPHKTTTMANEAKDRSSCNKKPQYSTECNSIFFNFAFVIAVYTPHMLVYLKCGKRAATERDQTEESAQCTQRVTVWVRYVTFWRKPDRLHFISHQNTRLIKRWLMKKHAYTNMYLCVCELLSRNQDFGYFPAHWQKKRK